MSSISFEALLHALIESRTQMQPMDFITVDLSSDLINKPVTFCVVSAHEIQALNLNIHGYGDAVLRDLFAPLFALGMNPSEPEYFVGEWREGAEGKAQLVALFQALQADSRVSKNLSIQASGPKFFMELLQEIKN